MDEKEQPTVVTNDLYLRTPGVRHEEDARICIEGAKMVTLAEFAKLMRDAPPKSRADKGMLVENGAKPVRDGFVEIKSEQITPLMQQAGLTEMQMLREAKRLVNRRRAAHIRHLRCELHYSWRMVAATCYKTWPAADWDPPFNQVMGMVLCEQAARFFDEDPRQEPWNDC